MLKSLVFAAFLFCLASITHAQAPDASTIQQAMNQGMELEFPHYQEIADVVVLRGGATVDGDFLFLCTGRLSWKLGTADLTAVLQQEIADEVERRGGDQELLLAMNVALTVRLSRIAPFQAGETATLVKFRLRLEQAGADWMVTESKMKESDRNPLTVLDL